MRDGNEDRSDPLFKLVVDDLASGLSAVVCSATPGNPVIFVSDAFEKHTGYAPNEVIGQNLSLLQGPQTEPSSVERFRHLIKQGKAGRIVITNYRKDGTPFEHVCDLRPIRDDNDEVALFVAIQRTIA